MGFLTLKCLGRIFILGVIVPHSTFAGYDVNGLKTAGKGLLERKRDCSTMPYGLINDNPSAAVINVLFESNSEQVKSDDIATASPLVARTPKRSKSKGKLIDRIITGIVRSFKRGSSSSSSFGASGRSSTSVSPRARTFHGSRASSSRHIDAMADELGNMGFNRQQTSKDDAVVPSISSPKTHSMHRRRESGSDDDDQFLVPS